MTPRRDPASLTLERLARRGEARPPLAIGLERPVITLPAPTARSWPRLPLEVALSAALVLLVITCVIALVFFDRAEPVTVAALPAEAPITIAKPQTLKIDPVDPALLGMIAPALQPAGSGNADFPSLHITIDKNPAFAEVKTASIKDIESQVKDDPADPQPLLRLGALYADDGKFEKAAGAYAKAYDLDPASARSAYNLAVMLEHLGKNRQAVHYYAKVMDDLNLAPGAPENTDVPVDTVRSRLIYLTR